ncbi:ABC-2 type transport system permease protein [Saccharomonospora amisosensis]|uniref:ABC-2 type transport system permease protein n=1 Tax=Saccharomonospora amisosensis TaxID=1128677 RepID=A0A7X5UL12_9PSEU|nr:ABC transporter permease [Saccharomonospora amisosensis]NIJ09933.1 ABC-2 type transport system permease protein [Saccharomonospora amisosensis]
MTTTVEHVMARAPYSSTRAGNLAGTWQLIRLALRRDRIVLPIWLLVLALTPAGTVGAYEQIYRTQAEREALTASMGENPSIALLYGPAFDLSTAGGFTAWRFGTLLPLFLALVCVFTMTRHTRQEEDTGRQELLSSTVLGRYAALTASVVVCSVFGLTAGLLTAGALIGAGLPATGSLALGLGFAAVTWVFTGVAAISAQLAEYSRTANGIASAVLGVTFAFRALGDAAGDVSWLSWLSPIGWSTQVRPFADERFWVLLIPLAVAIALTAVAYLLQPRRDIGMGLLPTSLGPAGAAPRLRTPFALASRLHRGVLIGWLTGFAVMAVLFGGMAAGIGDLVGTSEQARQMFERMGGSDAIVEAFLAAMANSFGMVATLYAVQAALRMRAEETAVRVEPLLATGVGRLRWLTGHLVFVLLGSGLLLAVAGVGMGLAHGLRVDDVGGQVPAVLAACIAQLPAVWLVAGAAVALFGLAPKLTNAVWAVAAVFLLISMFGPALNLDQAVLDVSPFQHIPKLPGEELTVAPLVWLSAIAVALIGAGMVAFRRRDIG